MTSPAIRWMTASQVCAETTGPATRRSIPASAALPVRTLPGTPAARVTAACREAGRRPGSCAAFRHRSSGALVLALTLEEFMARRPSRRVPARRGC